MRQRRGDRTGAGEARRAPGYGHRSDQRPDPLHGYLPKGWSWEEYQQKAESDPQGTILAAKRSMADHVQAMLAFHEMGVPTFDYGNNIRQMAQEVGVSNAFDFPGFVPAYIRPLFCRGIGPFRWVALSGDPQDIYKTDAKVKDH